MLTSLQGADALSAEAVQEAHNLAGMAGLLGEADLQSALKAIEDLPAARQASELPDLVDAARHQLAALNP